MTSLVIKTGAVLLLLGSVGLAANYAFKSTHHVPSPAPVCDSTQMVSRSPQYIKQYLGVLASSYGPRAKVYHNFDMPLTVFTYSRKIRLESGAVPVAILPAEAARLSGLNLSAFQPDAKNGYMTGDTSGAIMLYSVYAGTCKGVRYKQLKLSAQKIARDSDTINTAQQIGTGVYATVFTAISRGGEAAAHSSNASDSVAANIRYQKAK